MDKIKRTKINRLNIDSKHRLLFMSDIHSDYLLLDEILKKVHFSDNDYLFIVGDLYEKSSLLTNINALKYYIELNKKQNVYLMAGNCDEVLRFILPPVDKEYFLKYALKRGNSIINDMAYLMNYKLNENIDVDDFCTKAYNEFKPYYEFIDTLDDVIFLNDKIVLVHGGIFDLDNIPSEALNVLKVDSFYNKITKSPIVQIVGHYPTRNYRDDITSLNPIIDFNKNVICIDGGNQIVDGGQINLLLLDDINTYDFYFKAFTHYPKIKFNHNVDYKTPDNPYSICFGKNEIKILKEVQDYFLVEVVGTDAIIYVLKENVSYYNNKCYCYDGTNLFVSFRKDDVACIVKKREPFSYVNYDGILGLVDTKYIND